MRFVLIQAVIAVFAAVAIGGVIRRFARGELRRRQLVGWTSLWTAIAVAVLVPTTTETLARMLGVGRGVDVVLYLSVVFLIHLQFRTWTRLERMEREITFAVRAAALRDLDEEKKR